MAKTDAKVVLEILHRQAQGYVAQQMFDMGLTLTEVAEELEMERLDVQIRIEEWKQALVDGREASVKTLVTQTPSYAQGGIIAAMQRPGPVRYSDTVGVGAWWEGDVDAAKRLLQDQVQQAIRSRGKDPSTWAQPRDGHWGDITVSEDFERNTVLVLAQYVPDHGTPSTISLSVPRHAWL